jgi:hypothetical protein
VTVTTYSQWIAAGSPWKPAAPVDSLAKVLRGHGYTVYTLGNEDHATADPPEDHMPYSHTPWPGAQPYDYVLACDIMPPPSGKGLPDLAALGQQLVADKKAGVAPWIKYLNWTDSAGKCWHESWQPDHARTGSTDRGHIHVSIRTDYVTKVVNYDPVANIRGEGMANEPNQVESATNERVLAIEKLKTSIKTSWAANADADESVDFVVAFLALIDTVQRIEDKVNLLTDAGQGSVDVATATALRTGADALDPPK